MTIWSGFRMALVPSGFWVGIDGLSIPSDWLRLYMNFHVDFVLAVLVRNTMFLHTLSHMVDVCGALTRQNRKTLTLSVFQGRFNISSFIFWNGWCKEIAAASLVAFEPSTHLGSDPGSHLSILPLDTSKDSDRIRKVKVAFARC